jgi:hypothetical protein
MEDTPFDAVQVYLSPSFPTDIMSVTAEKRSDPILCGGVVASISLRSELKLPDPVTDMLRALPPTEKHRTLKVLFLLDLLLILADSVMTVVYRNKNIVQ